MGNEYEENRHICGGPWVVECDGSGLQAHDCGEDSCCCADPEMDREMCPGCPSCCEACDNGEPPPAGGGEGA